MNLIQDKAILDEWIYGFTHHLKVLKNNQLINTKMSKKMFKLQYH